MIMNVARLAGVTLAALAILSLSGPVVAQTNPPATLPDPGPLGGTGGLTGSTTGEIPYDGDASSPDAFGSAGGREGEAGSVASGRALRNRVEVSGTETGQGAQPGGASGPGSIPPPNGATPWSAKQPH